MKQIIKFALGLSLMLLCGCMPLNTGDELLKAPKPPKDYLALQNELDKVLGTGAVYAAPETGEHRNTVQLVDIDADGEEEAIAIFRQSPTAGKFLVNIYKKQEEIYHIIGSIGGTGTSVHSISYPTLGSNGAKGILLTWKLGRDHIKGMTVAADMVGTFQTLLETDYIDYITADMNGDGIEELLTIHEEGPTLPVRLFSFNENKVSLLSESSLSTEAKRVQTIKNASLTRDTNAIFIESNVENMSGLLTDIFIFENGGLKNLLMDSDTGSGLKTYRPIPISSTDINKDGIIELPLARKFPGYRKTELADALWILDWLHYDTQGKGQIVLSTYRNSTEGWRFELPAPWTDGNVTAVKKTEGGLSFTSFELYKPDGKNIPLLEIHSYAGDGRFYYAALEGNEKIAETSAAVICATLPTTATSGYSISIEEVKQRFSLLGDG